MIEYYSLKIDDNLMIKLPLVETDDISYYSLNIMGMHKLNKKLAELLHQEILNHNIIPEVILTVEAKAIGLVEQLSDLFGIEKYTVVRKSKKSYMKNPISSKGTSIISKDNVYWLDEEDLIYLKGKKVIFCDDVISSGGTIEAVKKILDKHGIIVKAYVTALTEGTDWKDIDGVKVIKLGHFPLPEKKLAGEKND